MNDLVAKSLETPEGLDVFLDESRRSRITLETVVLGRGMYRSGWRWYAHVQPMAGHDEAHVGYIMSAG